MTQGTQDSARTHAAGTPAEFDMALANENFGTPDGANEALAIVIDTARREMVAAQHQRATGDWVRLAVWVHRTRGALVLFGAPALRALGERFEEKVWTQADADAAASFDGFLSALVDWLARAEDHLDQARRHDL